MKKLLGFLLLIALFAACQNNEVVTSDFTGNQSTYALQAGSTYPVNGTIIFKERKDGSTTIAISLAGITDSNEHPVHLHLGDMTTDKAAIAALLAPVAGKTGQSETIIKQLADETKVTYSDLIKLSACVKIHLASVGNEANIILAAGNIGAAGLKANPGGRTGIAVCSSK